ncbi:MAG: ferritin-like domain-containing protein [Chloroflexota bacterium]|nr:ferritin-like domain-containing protein [Chloroflexota bacterium]
MDAENTQSRSGVSRRNVLKTIGIGGSAAALTFGMSEAVNAQTAGDDPQTILNLASTAEALAVTAFHSIITLSTFYGRLQPVYQNYLKSALTQEMAHYNFLVAAGAKPLANQFFFPNGILENLNLYVFVTDVLEGVFIGAYLASVRRFAELNRPDLAWTSASVMGIEAEHKALNRAMGISEAGNAAGNNEGITNSPTREPFEPATLFQVSQAVPTLGPVLTGGVAPASAGRLVAGVNFGLGPVRMPTAQQVNAVGNPLTPVPAPLQAFNRS